MDLETTDIHGCFVVNARVINDARGAFVKTVHEPTFDAWQLRTDWREEYFSVSVKDVVRGMHFQLPPADHAKLVFCMHGEVLDVVLDLRRGSPTFGQVRSFLLSPANGRGIYLPTGCAHGFVSLSAESVMYYKVTSVHSAAHDAGIAWDSIGFDWPVSIPLMSERDRTHPKLDDFASPFTFDASGAAT